LIEALHTARRRAQGLAEDLRMRVLELAEVDRRKDEFLALLGHELRNPLAPICHSLHVLYLTDDAPTLLWARGVMERQVNHLSRLVEELLDSSRVACGKIVLRRERLDLTRLARDVLEDHATEVKQAGLALESDLPEAPVWVEADATRLCQVLSNLLKNAAKFTDPGGAGCLFAWPWTWVAGGQSSTSGTPASASSPKYSLMCLKPTPRGTVGWPAAGVGSAWGWRWSRRSSNCTGAKCARPAKAGGAVPSFPTGYRWRGRRLFPCRYFLAREQLPPVLSASC
jgi:hypothetical protein